MADSQGEKLLIAQSGISAFSGASAFSAVTDDSHEVSSCDHSSDEGSEAQPDAAAPAAGAAQADAGSRSSFMKRVSRAALLSKIPSALNPGMPNKRGSTVSTASISAALAMSPSALPQPTTLANAKTRNSFLMRGGLSDDVELFDEASAASTKNSTDTSISEAKETPRPSMRKLGKRPSFLLQASSIVASKNESRKAEPKASGSILTKEASFDTSESVGSAPGKRESQQRSRRGTLLNPFAPLGSGRTSTHGSRFQSFRASNAEDAYQEWLAKSRAKALDKKNRLAELRWKERQRNIFFTGDEHHWRESKRDAGEAGGLSGCGAAKALGGQSSGAFVGNFAFTPAELEADANRREALHRRAARKHSGSSPTNFYDVVETEQEPASQSDFSGRLAGKITTSLAFQRFILSCIMLNTILSVLYTDRFYEQNYGRLIDMADSVFLTVFVIEIALKMKFQKAAFWKDNWNMFDFFIILVSMLGTVVRDVGSRKTIDGRMLRFMRVLRAFRTLRVLGALRKLQIVVNTFLKSLLELTNIIMMILLLIFMFSILGLQIFEEYSPEYFGTLVLSFQSLFILITQDGWVKIWFQIEDAIDKDGTVTPFTQAIMHLYFIVFIVVGAWVFINIISGITVTNWQLYVDEMKKFEKEKFHAIPPPMLPGATGPFAAVATAAGASADGAGGDAGTGTGSEVSNEAPVGVKATAISKHNVNAAVWARQIPLSSGGGIGRMSVHKLESYMLVVSALDSNLAEYRRLKATLKTQLDIVHSTNLEVDGDPGAAQELPIAPSHRQGQGSGYSKQKPKNSFAGDALSALQTMDEDEALGLCEQARSAKARPSRRRRGRLSQDIISQS